MTLGQVRVHGGGDWPVARLAGEVDLSNVEALSRLVQAAVTNAAVGLVLDLTGVSYLDSTGLRMVFQLARELNHRQQQLVLVVPSDALIWPVLRCGGVPGVMEVFASVSDALAGTMTGALPDTAGAS